MRRKRHAIRRATSRTPWGYLRAAPTYRSAYPEAPERLAGITAEVPDFLNRRRGITGALPSTSLTSWPDFGQQTPDLLERSPGTPFGIMRTHLSEPPDVPDRCAEWPERAGGTTVAEPRNHRSAPRHHSSGPRRALRDGP